MVAETDPGEDKPKKPQDNRVGRPSFIRRYVSQVGIIGVGFAMWLQALAA